MSPVMATVSSLGIVCPTGWTATSFGQLCSTYGGSLQTGPFGSQLHASDYSTDGTPVVMPQDLVDGRISTEHIARVSGEHALRLAQHRLEVGDIVYSRRGDVTRFAIVDETHFGWLCGTGCLRIRVGDAPLDSAYVRWFLEHPALKSWLIGEAKGATMPNLNTTILSALPLLFPPLPEQKRIAAILDKADAIRRKRQQAIELTESLLRSAFLEMFGDPVTNPKGWETRTLGDMLCFITSGSRGWAKYYSNDGARFLRIQNVGTNRLLLDDLAHVQAPNGAEAERTCVREGDILLSITADLGRTAVIPPGFGRGHISQHLALLRIADGAPIYVSEFLASPGGQLQLRQLDRVGVKSGLNFDDVRGLKILCPPRQMQEQFARLHSSLVKYGELLGSVSRAVVSLSESLTAQAFFGRL